MLIDSITVNFLWGTFFGVLTFDACFPATLCACTAFEISSSSVEICDEMPTTKVSKPSREDSMKKYYDCRYMRTCFCNVTRSLSANARWSMYELSTERWRKAIDISCQSASHHLITSRKVLIYECYWVEVGTIERVLESIHFELSTVEATIEPQFPSTANRQASAAPKGFEWLLFKAWRKLVLKITWNCNSAVTE